MGEALIRHLDEDGSAWRSYEEGLARGEILSSYVEACFVLAGMDEENARSACEAAVREALASGVVKIRPEMQDLMAAARGLGWEVWVVSASVTPVVQAFGAHYDLDPWHIIGMDLAIQDGLYQAKLASVATYGQGKVDRILDRIGRLPNLAVGDTLTDLEMLRSAGDALVIGPRHPVLGAAAEKAGWRVQPVFEG
jgi:phosphoserine phosphatase